MSTNLQSRIEEHAVYLVARAPFGPGAPFREARLMISELPQFVRYEPPESYEAPAHIVVVMKTSDAGHAAALVAAQLQGDLDVWRHFEVRSRAPQTVPGPSALFS
jgi:hypothetical protein